MDTLTKRQKQILDYTAEYIDDNGISPTLDEIKRKFRLSAISTAYEHINSLKEKGYLFKDKHSSRAIKINNSKLNIIDIPILGKISAGNPIEALEDKQNSVSIASDVIKSPKGYYALKVVGDSMIDEGIYDGDIVIIKKQSVAENGQTVVAIIDENEATLKKIYKERNRFRLQPANQSLLPFYRKEVEIRGIVAQIIRNFNGSTNESRITGLNTYKTIDLFAGIGGIRAGFEKAGFDTVFSNDFDGNCKITYDLNYKRSKLVVEDIRKIGLEDIPVFDLLLGGFPCQAFSIAGYREGFNDKKGRGNLFFDIARIIAKKKPIGFMLENVKNLKSHDNGRTFKIIAETLAELGYHIHAKVLNSMEYGNVPQNRERIYIVGFKDQKHYDRFNFPLPIKLSLNIQDILEDDVPAKYYYNNKPLYKMLKDKVREEGKVYQWRRKYVRENKSGVCPTLTANMGMGGHNVPIIKDKKGIRKLTPLECARLQGFPVNYKLPSSVADSILYKQLGNSVTVTVVEAMAKEILKAMQD